MRSLVISDTHFGSPEALLVNPEVIEYLIPELEWAQEVIFNGDLFSLAKIPLPACAAAAQAFSASSTATLIVLYGAPATAINIYGLYRPTPG